MLYNTRGTKIEFESTIILMYFYSLYNRRCFKFSRLQKMRFDYYKVKQTLFLFQGMTRSWTVTFRGSRDARVDKYVVETNKLLIRLDKLISTEVPTESGKRKSKLEIICHLLLWF